MPREEKTRVTYEVSPRTDNTFTLVRHTKTEVHDGRGRNWRDSTSVSEELAVGLTAAQLGKLAQSAVDQLAYIAQHGWED